MRKGLISLLASAFLLISFNANAFAADTQKFKNCSALNKEYPGGISRSGATDMTKKKGKLVPASPKKSPVVDDAIYQANSKLDRDKDGVACEK